MKMYSVLLFVVCLNLATVLISTTNAFPNPGVGGTGIDSMTGVFDVTSILVGLAGGVSCIIGGVLLANVFLGAFAGLLWVGGVLIAPINWVLIGFPMLVSTVLRVMCENAGIGAIETAVVSNLFLGIFTVMFSVIFFMFLVELFSQRYIT